MTGLAIVSDLAKLQIMSRQDRKPTPSVYWFGGLPSSGRCAANPPYRKKKSHQQDDSSVPPRGRVPNHLPCKQGKNTIQKDYLSKDLIEN